MTHNPTLEGFHSRDLYTKFDYFEAVATQEDNGLGSKRLFCDHTSMQLFTTSNKDECALP